MNSTLRVISIFKSIQGEGLMIGIPSSFIRLAGCNLCCRYCDTKEVWNAENAVEISVDDVVKKVKEFGVPWVTITGGEPLLQLKAVEELVIKLKASGFRVCIETNGTVKPSSNLLELVDMWSVSPKLKSFGPKIANTNIFKDLLGDVMFKNITSRVYFKFVITEPKTDFEEIKNLIPDGFPTEKVVIQPNCYVIKYEYLVDYVLNNKIPYRVLPQLHKLINLP